jgi:hypothetical protein
MPSALLFLCASRFNFTASGSLFSRDSLRPTPGVRLSLRRKLSEPFRAAFSGLLAAFASKFGGRGCDAFSEACYAA